MKTVIKKELLVEISKQTGIQQYIAKEVINSFLEELKKQFRKGNRIEIREFGVFFPYFRKKRIYFNPRTKEKSNMLNKTILKFRSSKKLFF